MESDDAHLIVQEEGTAPATGLTDPAEDDEDYDPAGAANDNATIPPEASEPSNGLQVPDEPSRNASRTPQKQLMVGGFVAEESDEEEQEEAPKTHIQPHSGDDVVIEPTNTSGALTQSPPLPVLSQTASTPVGGAPTTAPETTAASQPTNGHIETQQNLNVGVLTETSVKSPVATDAAGTAAPAPQVAAPSAIPSAVSSVPKSRLPNDIIGQLEDRIAEDAKGDVDAWLGLIGHLRSKGKFDEVRKVYGRFFEIFPSAAEQWVAYARMELELDDLQRLEAIFNLALLKVQSIDLWSIYLAHIRRRNDIATDASGQGRQVVSQAYEFVINQVGQDKDSGQLWQDYISFMKSGPGVPGGSGWQDAQKMDLLRKAYQRAVCVPMAAVTTLWKEYDSFEMGLNKMTGRKFLQEKSPAYVTARSSYTALNSITANLRRGVIPRLPPHPGYEGDEDYRDQVAIWQSWVAWEKEDPLVLKDEDSQALSQRILFVYRQAVMAIRFWPRIWFEAAHWCFEVGLEADGVSFLDQGLEANPESSLLAFAKADYLERTLPVEEGDESMISRGKAVRAPYDGVLDRLYKHIETIHSREKVDVAQIEAQYEALPPDSRDATPEPGAVDDDDDTEGITRTLSRRARKDQQIAMRKVETMNQTRLTSRTITFVWIALMRAMRRIQGKGKPGEPIGGMRGVFKDARTRGRLMADIHVATALLEHHVYKDPAAPKIFNLGAKLFPEDENFALEHIKFLISIGDSTNARVVFETTVSRITSKPENTHRAKVLFTFFHDWESKYGEVAQVTKIEKRMAELYPEEKLGTLFSTRFGISSLTSPSFDPCSVLLVLSPTQVRPKNSHPAAVLPSIETSAPPPVPQTGYLQSPKRPLEDFSDAEMPARKLMRGESPLPLAGAAGRRQQQRLAKEMGHQSTPSIGPKPLPPAIFQLLSIMPPARQWDQTRFDPAKMVDLVRSVDLTQARVPQSGAQYGATYNR